MCSLVLSAYQSCKHFSVKCNKCKETVEFISSRSKTNSIIVYIHIERDLF